MEEEIVKIQVDKKPILEAIERQTAYNLELQKILGEIVHESNLPSPRWNVLMNFIFVRFFFKFYDISFSDCTNSRHEKIEKQWLIKMKKVLGAISKMRRRLILMGDIPIFIKETRNTGKRWKNSVF